MRVPRSNATLPGYQATSEVEPSPGLAPDPVASGPAVPWSSEVVYQSPSGRIFLPPDFDFAAERPRTRTRESLRREPPVPQRTPRCAPANIHECVCACTRETWAVPPHRR